MYVYIIERKNLNPGATTKKCHSETGHTKMIPNYRNTFGV